MRRSRRGAPLEPGGLDRRDLLWGALAGVVGAVVMALVMMLVTAEQREGFWTPLQLLGAAAFRTGYQTVASAVLGAVLHLMTGAALGALLAAITSRLGSDATEAIVGVLFGAAVFAPMTYLLLPIVNPVMYAEMHLGVLFLAHLVYGLVTGVVLGARASRRRRAQKLADQLSMPSAR